MIFIEQILDHESNALIVRVSFLTKLRSPLRFGISFITYSRWPESSCRLTLPEGGLKR